ncbi:MAG TPA: fibronectin type III domain-containing protein [Candidatus Koribacter sp.]
MKRPGIAIKFLLATGAVVSGCGSGQNQAPAASGAGSAVPHSVTLSWSESTPDVSGFNIHRGTVSGGPYTKINSNLSTSKSYEDTDVAAGKTYYYTVTAVKGTAESGYSAELTATIPTP